MQVLDRIQNLIKNTTGCSFFYAYLTVHDLEKLTLLSELSNDKKVIISHDNLIEMDDVWVPDYLHYLYLSFYSYLIVFVLDTFLLYYLYCDFFTSWYMNSLFDFTECSFADGFSELVAADSTGQRCCLFDSCLCYFEVRNAFLFHLIDNKRYHKSSHTIIKCSLCFSAIRQSTIKTRYF